MTVKSHGILLSMDLQKPCIKCGQTDRRPNGNCRPCHREGVKKWRARVRREALEVLGLQCSCPGCTEDRYVFLSINHIDGRERKSRSPYSRHRWITRNPEEARAKFQTLCFNCNHANHVTKGEGTHA